MRMSNSDITEICLRHGRSWQPWRRTGYKERGTEQVAFELEENEAVAAVGTDTGTDGITPGCLTGLEITTTTGRKMSWGDLDKDNDTYGEKRSTVQNAKLGFCSGLVQTDGDRRSLTFHWVME